MRWLVSTFLFLLAPSLAFAWSVPQNDAEATLLYNRLANDYLSAGIFKNADLNRLRDGKRSSYIDPFDIFLSQADPLPAEVLSILPEGNFAPFAVFNQAIRGLRQILANFPDAGVRSDVITIVDFSKKNESRRFLVLDLQNERVLFQTWVHHGRKSDANQDRLPELFSNVNDTNKSSVGFALASDLPYEGMWGYSLRMHGIDGALNSNMHRRAMVLHPWPNIHPRDIVKLNALEQASLGCLSLPYYESGKFYGKDDQPLSKLIIDTIKKRSVIFVTSGLVDLEKKSLYLKSTSLLPASDRAAIVARVNAESANQPSFTGGEEVETLPERYKDWMKNSRK